MKAFIDRVFKKRKQNAEEVIKQVEEQVIEQPIAQVESIKEQASQASIVAIALDHTDRKDD
jgi:hypothetical protein